MGRDADGYRAHDQGPREPRRYHQEQKKEGRVREQVRAGEDVTPPVVQPERDVEEGLVDQIGEQRAEEERALLRRGEAAIRPRRDLLADAQVPERKHVVIMNVEARSTKRRPGRRRRRGRRETLSMIRNSRHHREVRTFSAIAGLGLLSALAGAACSSSGNSSGAGGGGGAGASGGGAGGSVTGTGGATTGVAGASGTGGSAAGGAFGIAGPTRCDTTLPLCESFENGLDGNLWKTTKAGDATVAVDEVHAARGTHALHVKTVVGGGSNFAYIKETKTFPATNNVLYGRMFVWFEDALTTDGHFSLAEGAGTGTPAVIRFGGQFKAFGVGTDGGSSGDWTDSDRTKLVPTQTWICAEFQFDGPTNTFNVWWDDMARPMLTSGPSKHASFTMPTFNGLWFGWWMYNLAEPQDIWIDEIAVDYKPIGCAK
jgi:hypothetical protein